MIWKDEHGKRLSDYPHPSVAVDVALLTVLRDGRRSRLAALLHRRPRELSWALPGTFLRLDERLDEAALRALRDKVGVTGQHPRQLKVFDDPARDPRGRVLSVAHVDLVRAGRLEDRVNDEVILAPIDGFDVVLPGERDELAFDHADVVREAVRWARSAYDERPDPAGLLDAAFTLYELRRLHEAVSGVQELQKDTFRRHMDPHLEETGEWSTGTVGRPARLYRRRTQTG
ncbi:NUDIX domain-containing protein [Amycolatopsis cynarae]|uniref:NUDIX domain-containing protein n=1 Tax=Amycolatopsis cynarae TaxID=2995223 RepID=A0ABY7B846_9PSEU|nr:NUDIX domain-containing protein [Amycolatopsis sp. HUAS 11-8]WAL68522.1 NUDIX domain-containing protein [Amycolatopsis sp. HUAS 11-8]